MGEKRHVIPNSDGGWDVLVPGAEWPSSQHRTLTEAKRVAREFVARAGGGEVVLHLRDGDFRDIDTGPE